MAHARQQIRDTLKALLLAAGTSAGTNVETCRPYRHETSKLPSLTIWTPNEEVEAHDGGGATYTRFCNTLIEARVKASSTSVPMNALDDLCAQVEAAIGADPTLAGLVVWTWPTETNEETDGEQEKVVALASMVFRSEYKTTPADPTAIIGGGGS